MPEQDTHPTPSTAPRPANPRKHIVISGTGRAGTTFLVELLTHLGLDTGYSIEEIERRKDCVSHAGLEGDILKDDCPRVIKGPAICDIMDEILARRDILIERVIVPMRDLHAAAESRRHVRAAAVSKWPLLTRITRGGVGREEMLDESEWPLLRRIFKGLRPKRIPGGLWHTRDGEQQEAILMQKLYQLILALSGTDIPVTLLRYPRSVTDSAYLLEKLRPILGDITDGQFLAAFNNVARPELVHQFGSNDR
jgi:hypothetical protein